MDRETPLITVKNSTRIGPLVRKDLWNRFKRMVKGKYGKTKWYTSLELNEALDLYLRVRDGELVVFDAVYLKNHGDYAHTDGHLYNSETFVVKKFKRKFRTNSQISYNDLKRFVVEDCGFSSRTKFYDVRDELLAKEIIDYYGTNKKTFLIKGTV